MKVKAVTTQQTPLGRWIIVMPMAKDWAWSGSRWINHHNGISLEAQVANFETEKEALEYAQEHCIVREKPPTIPAEVFSALDKIQQNAEKASGADPAFMPKHKPRPPELTPWRHAICDKCWQKREPGKEPIRLKDADPVDCCFCNKRTHSRIFVRADSADMPCGGRH